MIEEADSASVMPANGPELSVVVPMYNAAPTVSAQLDAILGQQWSAEWEVVVADNGSTDAGPSIVREICARDERVRLVDASDVRGPAHARNAGVAHARGTSIAFCDADDVVAPGWLAAMGGALRRSPAATGPQEQTALNPLWLQNVYGARMAESAQLFADVFPFGPSSNLGVQRDVFMKLGGFEPGVHVGEDIELCLRLWSDGQQLEFVPGAVVHYRNRSSLRAIWRQAKSYGEATPMIVARLERLGHPVGHKLRGVRRWLWLLRRLPTLGTKAGQARWLVVAGRALGQLIGSVRYRTLYL